MACQTFPPAPYSVCGAILDKYNELGGPNSFLLYPTSDELTNPDGVGKRSTFMNGPIYWHPDAGAHPVVNHFFACWQRNGWEGGRCGTRHPMSSSTPTASVDVNTSRAEPSTGSSTRPTSSPGPSATSGVKPGGRAAISATRSATKPQQPTVPDGSTGSSTA